MIPSKRHYEYGHLDESTHTLLESDVELFLPLPRNRTFSRKLLNFFQSPDEKVRIICMESGNIHEIKSVVKLSRSFGRWKDQVLLLFFCCHRVELIT
jgi:hypothetical protein